jgi:hypothetical protein
MVGKPGNCEYEEGQTFTTTLLEKTRLLEERLAAMEGRPPSHLLLPSYDVPDLMPSDFSDSPRASILPHQVELSLTIFTSSLHRLW